VYVNLVSRGLTKVEIKNMNSTDTYPTWAIDYEIGSKPAMDAGEQIAMETRLEEGGQRAIGMPVKI